MGFDRREALWTVSTKDHQKDSMFIAEEVKWDLQETVSLPKMTLSEHVVHDYHALSLSVKAHPVSFLRDVLASLRVCPATQLKDIRDGDRVRVAGLVLVRQRPGTAKGVCFITIEDETGSANLVVFPDKFDAYRKEIIQSRLLMVEGKLQKEGEVIHVMAERCFNISGLLQRLVPEEEEVGTVGTTFRAD